MRNPALPFALTLLAPLLVSCATVPGTVIGAQPFPESQFLTAQGLSVHYRHWKPEGPAKGQLLLIHGFGASTFSFRNLVPALVEAGWEVAAADLPPFGYSEKDAAKFCEPADRRTLLWSVPDALGWTGPVVLLGHSLGGQIAVTMAEAFPERTRALVLMAAAVPTNGKAPGRAPFFTGLATPFIQNGLKSPASVKKFLQSFAKGEEIPDEMAQGYFEAFQPAGGVAALVAWARAGGQPAVHPSQLTMPSLLLWGGNDTIVPVATGEWLHGQMAGSVLTVVPGRSHLMHELQPELTAPPIVVFLSDLP